MYHPELLPKCCFLYDLLYPTAFQTRLELPEESTGWGKSRVTVVCMENNTIINNNTRINTISCTHNCKCTLASTCINFLNLFKDFIYLFFRQREREGEKHQCLVCLLHAADRGPGPQPMHVP